MNKRNINKLVPELRFKSDKGINYPAWECVELKAIAKRQISKNKDESITRVLTNSAINGIVDQRDFFDKDIAVKGNLGNYYIVDKGDFVYNPRISSTAPVGPISRNRIGKGVMSPLYTVFRFHDQTNNFYEQYFKSSKWHKYLQTISNIGARHDRMNISNDDFMHMPVPAPVPQEKQKISDFLNSLDEIISLHSKKLNELRNHKRALLQQLFPNEGETVPKIRVSKFRNSKEWSIKPFSKLFTIGSGRDYKHLSTGNIPVYGSGGYMLSVNDYLYDGQSVCIGRKGTINKPIFLSGKFWTVDTLFYTHSFINCLPQFIYIIFQRINWKNYNEAGGVPSLSKSNIEKIEVAIPSIEEQKIISNIFKSLDEIIDTSKKEVEKLKTYKVGLTQKIFPMMDDIN